MTKFFWSVHAVSHLVASLCEAQLYICVHNDLWETYLEKLWTEVPELLIHNFGDRFFWEKCAVFALAIIFLVMLLYVNWEAFWYVLQFCWTPAVKP